MSSKKNKHVTRQQIADLVYNEEPYIKELAEATESSFTEFKENYRRYLLERDEMNFRKAGHKIKPVVLMLNLDEILEEYENAKTLLWDDEEQKKLEQSVKKVEKLCDQIIKDLINIQAEG